MTASNATRDRKRFTTGNHADIEDIADPHTLEDETHDPLLERIKRHWKPLVVIIPITLASLGVLMGYMWHLVPALLGNFWFQLGAAFAAAMATTAYFTNQWRLGWLKVQDELILSTPNGLVKYNCKVRQNKYGGPIAVPIKGYRWFYTKPEYYTIREFGHELGLTWANANVDPDDPAAIELHPNLVSITRTDTGTIIEQQTGEKAVDVDEFAREAMLYATTPVPVERDTAELLRSELVKEREERQELDHRLEAVKRRLEAAKDIGAMEPDEYLESHRDFAAEIMAVTRGRKRPSEKDETDPAREIGSGSTTTSYDFSDVEAELTDD